jgi:hypothetical protein
MTKNGDSLGDSIQAGADARADGAFERDGELNDVTAKSEAENRSGFLGGLRSIFSSSDGGHGASDASSDGAFGDPSSGGTGYMD